MDEASRRAAAESVQQFRQGMEAATAGNRAVAIATRYGRLAAAAQGEYLSSLISFSRDTASAWDALRLIAQQLLQGGAPIPSELSPWISDVLEDAGKLKKAKQRPRPRRDPDANSARNELMACCVGLLVGYGFTATRNSSAGAKAGDGCSACDVVGQEFGLGYKAVEDIWTRSFTRQVRPRLERAAVLLDMDRNNRTTRRE